jgi:NAD(P)-dependent dehydrogenase (short-subunit alcohol dehydrogenase family)
VTSEQRTAVVTGGAGGIGTAICAMLTSSGHRVVSLDRVDSDLPDVATVSVDLADASAVTEVAAHVLRVHNRCDVLVHCAADLARGDLDQLDLTVWRRVQAVNVETLVLLTRAFAPGMTSRRFGRIVSVTSDTVYSPPSGDLLAYVTSKAALIGLTRTLAVALGGTGVAVTAVAPGLTLTDAARAGRPSTAFDDVISRQALARPLLPDDVASAVAFLVSDGAAALTGQTLCVDGGLVLR